MRPKAEDKPENRARRGSIYLAVLAAAMLVTVIGLGSLLVVRIQWRSAQANKDLTDARYYALSAVELGFLLIEKDVNWRGSLPSGAWIPARAIGGGTLSLQVTDPRDGNLADSQYDPLLLTGIGVKGQARHLARVTLVPNIRPLEALNTCIHSSGMIRVKSNKRITLVGAPVSTNGALENRGTIDGSAEAVAVIRTGRITGTLTVPAPPKDMPAVNVFEGYRAKATVIPFTGTIEDQVLSAGCNPWGPTNPEGVYFIDTGGSDLKIKNTRIHGTLIVRALGRKVVLDEAVLLHSHRSDYPVLLVEGDVEMELKSAEYGLSEAASSTNFNPAGAAYKGHSDADMRDLYPNEVQGLVHVRGSLVMKQTALVRGVVVCEGQVKLEGFNRIVHNASLYASPPEGYTYLEGMKIAEGSWQQVVD